MRIYIYIRYKRKLFSYIFFFFNYTINSVNNIKKDISFYISQVCLKKIKNNYNNNTSIHIVEIFVYWTSSALFLCTFFYVNYTTSHQYWFSRSFLLRSFRRIPPIFVGVIFYHVIIKFVLNIITDQF